MISARNCTIRNPDGSIDLKASAKAYDRAAAEAVDASRAELQKQRSARAQRCEESAALLVAANLAIHPVIGAVKSVVDSVTGTGSAGSVRKAERELESFERQAKFNPFRAELIAQRNRKQ